MPTVKNISQLHSLLLRRVESAMDSVQREVLKGMYTETYGFYTSREPKVYQRTGALGDSPRVTTVTVKRRLHGGKVSFEAYLDTNYTYTSGRHPNMLDVLNVAENYKNNNSSVGYLRPPVGKQGFWRRSQKRIDKAINKQLGKFFAKG